MPPMILDIQSVTFAYSRGASVLREVSLALAAGEVLALVGPNGGGKSTLLRVALGQLRAEAGQVKWWDRPVSRWSRRQLARRVAYLPQSPGAWAQASVRDVLASGRSPYWGAFGVESSGDRDAVIAVAERLRISQWLDRPIESLSGGQAQRVFLGRSLAQLHGAGGALLLDEPDTFLDLRHAAELGRLIRDLAHVEGHAVLLASHDLNLAARVADRVALLADGRVIAAGAPAEVLEEGALEAAYGVALTSATIEGRRVIVPRMG